MVPAVEASIASVRRHASDTVIIHFIGMSPLPTVHDIDFLSLEYVHERYNLTRFVNPHMTQEHVRLASLANYVRFVVAEIFPDISKVLWLDADTIVKCDVVGMVRSALTSTPYALAAVPVKGRPDMLSDSFVTGIRTYFIAGVFVADLHRWRNQGLTRQIEYWVERNQEEHIYHLGSQPPMNLAIGDDFEHLDPLWHVADLGWKPDIDVPDNACLLHWNGIHKWWVKDGYHLDEAKVNGTFTLAHKESSFRSFT